MACDRSSIVCDVESFTLDRYIHEYQLFDVDTSSIFCDVDNFTLDRYMHEYQLYEVYGVNISSSSAYILDAPNGNVGFYLRHLACGLRLHPSSFFLEVLCFYDIHPV